MSDETTPRELKPETRQRWSLYWEQGGAYASDARHGLEALTLRLDGRLRYERRQAEQRFAAEAQVAFAEVDDWIAAIRESGFPRLPDPNAAPGADLVGLAVIGPYGRNAVHFSLARAQNWPGYGWLARAAAAWFERLRADAPAAATDAPSEPAGD